MPSDLPGPPPRGGGPRGRVGRAILALFAAATAAGAAPPVVVVQVPVGTAAEAGAPRAGSLRPADLGAGARLLLIGPDGARTRLAEGFHSACDPDVSWDGTRLLFAGKRAAADPWGVFELTLATGAVRPIPTGPGDARSPHYESTFYTITEALPWEQIGLVRTRDDGARDEWGGRPATSLFTCKPDGTALRRNTFNLSSDFDPVLLADGRLLYATYRRATLDDGLEGRVALETINVDGSDRAPFVPAGPSRRVAHMPCVTTAGLALFVDADAVPWDGAGPLSSVSLRRPLHTYRRLTDPADGLYRAPSPLPDGRVLVAWRPADGSGTLGLYRFDPETRSREPVLDDPDFHEIAAKAVVPRARPDGRSSVVDPADPAATLYVLDLYTTAFADPSWLPRGSVKSVRVVEGLPVVGDPPAGVPPLAGRRVLGEVPVESDGSLHLRVPADTPLQLQALDADGVALRSCGWIWARAHQAQGCIGCHEDPERTPPNRMPLALRRDASDVLTEIGARKGADFRSEIAPILMTKCAPGHGAGQAAPRLDGASDEAGARRAYEAMLRHVDPGRARTSPLAWHVLGRNAARPYDGAVAGREAVPIPDGGPPLSGDERRAIVRWIDLGAPWASPPR
jgi:Tol biopolymer transport system component